MVDHNKIVYGEEDAPGAAFDGFRQQLDAFGEEIRAVSDRLGMFLQLGWDWPTAD